MFFCKKKYILFLRNVKLKQKQQTKLTVDKKIKEMFDLHFDEKQPFQRKCEQTEKSFP